jgi:hypothetical protein
MLKKVILGDGEYMLLEDLKDVAAAFGLEDLAFGEQEFEDGHHLLAGFPADDAEDMRNLHNMIIENNDQIEATAPETVDTPVSTGWAVATVVVGNYELSWVTVR